MPDADVDKDARTEEPTPRRIEEAREKGRVAKSQEITSVLVTFAGLVFMWIYMPFLYRAIAALVRWAVEGFAVAVPCNPAAGALVLTQTAWQVLVMLAPLAGVVIVMGVFSNVVQFGFLAAAEPLKPDIGRINPTNGIKRFFSLRTAEQFALSVTKMALAALVLYFFLKLRAPRLVALVEGTVHGGVVVVMREIFFLALALLTIFLCIAVLDLLFQRQQYLADLRMTRQEMKEELRRMEGDPAIRARRRAAMRRLVFSRMFAEVPESDVVVTNPTEFAVAIRYKQEDADAPVVVAKGRLRVAEHIREIAVDSGIPIVERPLLARGLYFAVEVGSEVPPEFYQMVAEVLAYVYRVYPASRQARDLEPVETAGKVSA